MNFKSMRSGGSPILRQSAPAGGKAPTASPVRFFASLSCGGLSILQEFAHENLSVLQKSAHKIVLSQPNLTSEGRIEKKCYRCGRQQIFSFSATARQLVAFPRGKDAPSPSVPCRHAARRLSRNCDSLNANPIFDALPGGDIWYN